MEKFNDSIKGAFFGSLIGDALGTRYEFKPKKEATLSIINDVKNNKNILPILGGGPFELKAGQVTDDSELALAMFNSIQEKKTYDKEDVAKKYIYWFNSGPFDCGRTTRIALSYTKCYNDIVLNSKFKNYESLSNGCLMRITPLAIYGCTIKEEKLLQYCKEDCMMTNPNPLCIKAVQFFCISIKTAIFIKNKVLIHKTAIENANDITLVKLLESAKLRPEPVYINDDYYDTDCHYMGYIGIAIQNAFYELLNGNSFDESLINIIKRGGDTDTNACIAGSLLGAYYGYSKINKKWIESIKINPNRSKKYSFVDLTNIENQIEKFIKIILNPNNAK